MNEETFFYELNNNYLNNFNNNNFLNHINYFFNTLEFEKYYIDLIKTKNINQLVKIHIHNITYYDNIILIWINEINKDNINLFLELLDINFNEYILINENCNKLIDKLLINLEFDIIINNKNVFYLFLSFIEELYDISKSHDINNNLLLLYLKIFDKIKSKNYDNFIKWYYSDFNNLNLNECLLNYNLNKPKFDENSIDNKIEFKLFWYLNKIIENNIYNFCRFILKYKNINIIYNYNIKIIKEKINEIIIDNYFLKFIKYTNNFIYNTKQLDYLPEFFVNNVILINIYLCKINNICLKSVKNLILLLFYCEYLNKYTISDLLYLLYLVYSDEEFFNNNKLKFIKLYNELSNIDNCNNFTLDIKPNFILIKIFKKFKITINNNKLYYKLFSNMNSDLEYYFNAYIEKNKYLSENENIIINSIDDGLCNLKYIIYLLEFIKNNYYNKNYIYSKIIHKKIFNFIIFLIIEMKKNSNYLIKEHIKYYKIINYNIITYLYHIFNYNYTLEMFYYLNEKDNILDYIDDYINDYDINLIDIYNNNRIILNKKNINNDEELLDPLTYELIEDPYYLPNNILIDKYSIIEYLLEKEENPFNKLKLTINELINYNKKKEILKLREKIKKKLIDLHR